MIADLHAMTLQYDPSLIKERVRSLALDYLACGIDPEKSTIFIQSHIPEHTYLSWIFANLIPIAELERMHQFKEKTQKRQEGIINAGLFTYPVLMAADILIYKANTIPVGEDQKQHVELTRVIAKKFNNSFGQTFPEPATLLTPTPRIMSLIEPESKMSKSKGEKHYIALSDDETTIRKKIVSAVTDTGEKKAMSPGVENLFTLLKEFSKDAKMYTEFIQRRAEGTLKYQELKEALIEALLATLLPIQKRRKDLEARPNYVADILTSGTEHARAIAQVTFKEVREKTGLL